MKKILGTVCLLCLFSLLASLAFDGAAWAAETPAFEVTPEGAALMRERGSVGYLYWGMYQDCCTVDEAVFVESGAPDVAENARLGYEKVKGDYVKVEDGGLTLYIRTDMNFEGGVPQIIRRDYKGVTYLVARNALRD